MTETNNTKQFRILAVIIILDLLSATMTVPLFPVIITDPQLSIFGLDVTKSFKYWALTALYVCYGIAQLIGAPFFGGLSDKYGRKKVLAFIFVLNIVQYFMIAISIIYQSYILLLISRTTAGFAGGTVFIQQSAIADLSSKEDKAKNLGIVGIAFGIGLILGPLIGTWLADSGNHPSFSLATPFFAILFINTLNLMLLGYFFKESLTDFNKEKFSIFQGLKNIYLAFSIKNWRILFVTTTFVCAGLFFFLQFFQVMLEDRFGFGLMEQGLTLAYSGLIMALAQGVLLPLLTKRFGVNKLLVVFLPTLAIGYFMLAQAQSIPFLLISLFIMIAAQGICTPGLLAMISNRANRNVQGATIGINQSIQSFASIIPATLATSFVATNVKFPLLFGTVVTFLAFFIFYWFEFRVRRDDH